MKKLIAVLIAVLLVTSLTSLAWASDPEGDAPHAEEEVVIVDEETAVAEGADEEPALDGTEQGEEPVNDPVESEAPVEETPEPDEETSEPVEESEPTEETEGDSKTEETPLDGEPEEPDNPTETMDQIHATLPTALPDA